MADDGDPESPASSCPHAFHTECIVEWLAKKNDALPECPCCRRPFCTVVPLTTADLMGGTTADGTPARTTMIYRVALP
eukprot:jgi/Psemu1/186477/e_gw1.58.67.1